MTIDERINAQGGEHMPVRRPPTPPETQPHLLRAWNRLYANKNERLVDRPARRFRRVAVPLPEFIRLPVATSRTLPSRNWSGGSIVPHGGKQVVLQFGEWRVPEPKPPPHADQRIAIGNYGSSTWIGFDGNRGYINSSLPQIGTEQWLDAASGTARYDAFFQWWSVWEDKPTQYLYRLPDLPIRAETTIVAMLWAVDPYTVVAALATFGDVVSLFEQEFTSPPIKLPPGPVMTHPRISGATAEWIVERPFDDQPVPMPMAFPDYGKVDFDLCVAGTAAGPGDPTGEEVLDGPRLLRMFEVPPNAPSRTRVISHAIRTGETSLRVRYGHRR